MRVIVVHKTTRRSGRVTTRDEVLDVERVTIGRGPGNDLQLSGLTIEFHHSVLRSRADGAYIEKAEAESIEVNGRNCSEKLLKPKDRIRIGHFQLTVLPSQGSEDLRLALEAMSRRKSEMEELASRTVVGLSRGAFTERKLAWLSVIAIPIVFAAVPMLTGKLETFWDTGPMARAHTFFSDDCQKCHSQAFTRVLDTQCLECHADISAHTPVDVNVIDLESTRCATCHMEHNGEFKLQQLEQELCAECHTDLGTKARNTLVRAVSDFSKDHPEFRLTVPTETFETQTVAGQGGRAGAEVWTRKLERIEWTDGLQEHSGVKFNHVRHVAREELKGGKVLDCGDCHQEDPAGKNMASINFEKHCQECHSLGFDERFEGRQAFHGDPVAMRADLLEFFTAIELRKEEGRTGVRRERVGQEEMEARREAAMRTAQTMVDRANAFLMDDEKPGACANCHFVERGAATDGSDDVAPVRLLDLWMPMSVFRHQTHEPFPCRDCHPRAAVYDPEATASYESEKDLPPVERERPSWSYTGKGRIYALYEPAELREQLGLDPSAVATDVLIPKIDRCQTCHGGGHAASPLVASECVLCHPFHRKEYDRMRPAESLPAAQNELKPFFFSRHGAG